MDVRRTVAALLAVVTLTAACSSGSGSKATSSSPSKASSSSGPGARYYVSVGDSYAEGYQPGADVRTNRNGFAYQVADQLGAAGEPVQLANFGCGGATTASILEQRGCKQLGVDAVDYPDQTQAAAAEAFLRDHAGRVALVTVSISGNDVTKCATAPEPVPCVADAVNSIKANLGTLLDGLRAAAGPQVPIVGITYPDVILGLWVSGDPSAQNLAKLSVVAFQQLINPALKAAYEAAGGRFVDVTEATGAYGSFDETTTLDPYGALPAPVAKACQLTYFCEQKDIHPTTEGYRVIADLVVAAYRGS